MEFFDWLAKIFEELFPPWVIVDPNDTGVRVRSMPMSAAFKEWADGRRFLGLLIIPPHGQIIREVGQGFVFSIPFIDEVFILPTKFSSHDLDNIEVETATGEVYDISPVLEWKVLNPIKAATAVTDYETSLKNRARSIIVRWANKQVDRIEVEKLITECEPKVKQIGSDWGCTVRQLEINSIARPWEVHEHVLKHQFVPGEGE